MRQLDAVNAFTNSDLDEIVYIQFLDSFENPSFYILLLRALYRLRRSLLLWFIEFSSTLKKLGLKPISEVEYVYVSLKLIIFFFVDDIAILYCTNDVLIYNSFQTQLFDRYEMHDLSELKWFLGIRIIRD
jgi:Reverse transcriptase (RNA-dependent DNA polymerase)